MDWLLFDRPFDAHLDIPAVGHYFCQQGKESEGWQKR